MVQIIRSRRKTVSIEVKSDGSLVVRAPLWVSEKKIDLILQEKKDWILKQQNKIAHRPKPEIITPSQREALRAEAKRIIPARVSFWAEKTGFAFRSVRITSARGRFGSCSGRNDLSFSLYLSAFAPDLIDYVIVHELCHTEEHNHSPAFYHLLAGIFPDWKERQIRLRSIPLPEVTSDES